MSTVRWRRRMMSSSTFHCRGGPCRVSSAVKIGSALEGLSQEHEGTLSLWWRHFGSKTDSFALTTSCSLAYNHSKSMLCIRRGGGVEEGKQL